MCVSLEWHVGSRLISATQETHPLFHDCKYREPGSDDGWDTVRTEKKRKETEKEKPRIDTRKSKCVHEMINIFFN